MKVPGALAGAPGDHCQTVPCERGKDRRDDTASEIALATGADLPEHIARRLGECLRGPAEDVDCWHRLSLVVARLPLEWRGALGWSVLRTLSADAQATVFRGTLPEGAGLPSGPFMDVRGMAEFWSARASPVERSAFAAACIQRMPDAQRRRLLAWAGCCRGVAV